MDDLIAAALAARDFAHAPYSGFRVGAALGVRDGRVFTGCNIENASYGLTLCAERVAIFKAMSEGVRREEFTMLVVSADTPVLTPPCGACRQIISEFTPASMEILLVNLQGDRESFRIEDLLPRSFNDSFIK